MSFSQKYIEVDFKMAQGVFEGSRGNTYTAKGLRVSAEIVKAGGLSLGQASVAIYGLSLSVMNQLGTFGNTLTKVGLNTITIKAGEDPNALTTVYIGTIYNAFMDGQSQPNVAFRVEASVSLYDAMKPVPVLSQPGSQDVATLAQQIAQGAGWQFEPNGVNVKVNCPYLPGTAVQQIRSLTKMAGLEHIIDCGTLALWTPGQARQGGPALVSPQTGLIGYPRFNSMGIDITALWQPCFVYGQKIKVESSITPACETWVIYRLEYALDSMTPNGRWFVNIMAGKPDSIVVA